MSKVVMSSPGAGSRQRSAGSATLAFTESERNRILEHLDEISFSPVFRNSKRNCALLRFVVERALDGQADQLKERTIGVEAFGRQADYDTNADHSVRSAAGEVRRRLAQYYMEFGNECGIRIEILPGSYVPQIHVASPTPPVEPEQPIEPPRLALAPAAVAEPQEWRRFLPRTFNPWVVFAAISAVLLAGLAARLTWPAQTPFDQLWKPILSSPNAALLCVGGGGWGGAPAATLPAAETVGDFERQPARNFNASDVLALVAVTGTLRASGKEFRILPRANDTSFKDLQQGPFILIGAFNNQWTLRLTEGLRFTFQTRAPRDAYIADRKNPGNASWSFGSSTPFKDVMRDYAVVTRLRDPKTEQTALIVAGIGGWGTQAAGEFVSNPNHLKKLERFAPRDWQQKNLQVVVATDIIRGSPGPPIVLAAEFW